MLQYHHRRTEPWLHATCRKIWWSSAMGFSSYVSRQTDRQTYSSQYIPWSKSAARSWQVTLRSLLMSAAVTAGAFVELRRRSSSSRKSDISRWTSASCVCSWDALRRSSSYNWHITTSGSKGTGYNSYQHASLLLESTCHVGSQWYLPPDAGDIPSFTPSEFKLSLATLEDARLSWPSWLVTYQGDISAQRWSAIPVPTGLNVE